MPTRPARLHLTHSHKGTAHTPTYPSLLANPSHPRSPSTPLTPPPRLHLRSVLPSTPISPNRLNRAPSPPYPWVWRCHLCHNTYGLGVTRRCLEDGHYFCALPSPPPTPSCSPPSSSRRTTATQQKMRRSRKKQVRGCRAEFDYVGWAQYNAWRREVRILKMGAAKGEGWEVDVYGEGKDCWRDCDFPSECLGLVNGGVPVLSVDGPESRVARDALRDFEGGEGEGEKGGVVEGVDVDDDDEGWKDMVTEVWGEEEEEEEEEEEDNEVEVEQRRRKSIQKIHQLTGLALNTDIPLVVPIDSPESSSSSPLKTFVSVNEEDLGEGNVWEFHAEDVADTKGGGEREERIR